MAEIKNPISQDLITSMNQFSEASLKAAGNLEKLIAEGNKLIEANNKVATSQESNKKKREQLTAVEKESLRIRNAQLQTHAKLDKARSTAVASLTKSKLELQKVNKEVKDNTIANKSAKGSYEQLNAELRLNLTRYKSLSKEQRTSKTNGVALKKTIIEQQKAIMNLDSSLLTHNRNVGNYGSALSGVAGNLLGAFGVVGGVTAFASVLKSSITTIVQYSSQNSKLASVLGKTKDEIEELTKSSLEYGRTTQFTATQVAQLQTELAKLGFTQGEVIDSTQAVLNLAAATGSDLGEAAKVSGAALRAMGLEASEMDRVASVLAVSTTKTALSFQDFSGNLSNILPVAKAFGFSIEDSVALFGKLRDAGFDASSASTATRNILLNLADTNGKLAKQIGGAVTNFDDMIDALVDLDSQGLQLGETLELTDKRSVAAFNQFLRGAEDARTLRDGLIDVNDELKVMVETRTDNAEGAVLRLSSAWDGWILRLKESDGFLKNFLDALTDTLTPAKTIGDISEKAFKAATSGLKSATGSATEYAASIQIAIDRQTELRDEAQKQIAVERGKVFGDPAFEIKQFQIQTQILKKLQEESISAQLASEAEGLAKRFDIENKSTEELKNLQKSYSSFTTGEMKRSADLILPLIEEQLKQREDLEKESNKKRAQEERASAAELKKIRENEAKAAEVIANGLSDDEIKLENDTLKEITKLRLANAKLADDSTQIIIDAEKAAAVERIKIEKDLQTQLKDARINLTAQAAQGISDVLFEASSQRRDEELERLEEERDEDIERVETEQEEDLQSVQDKLDLGLINEDQAASQRTAINERAAAEKEKIEEDLAKKESEIKTKQAKADKAAALIGVAINTALGISSALSKVATIPLIPFIAAAGAVEAATILATPIPKFFKGTDNAPDGTISTAEKGFEMIIEKSGNAFLTPDTQTFYSGLGGAQIIPHEETKRRLAEMGSGGSAAFKDEGIRSDLKKLIKVSKGKGSSNTVDNVTTTNRGNRMIKMHKAFTDKMRS